MKKILDTIIRREIREVYRLGSKPSLGEIIKMILDELDRQRIVINEKQLLYIEQKIVEEVWYL